MWYKEYFPQEFNPSRYCNQHRCISCWCHLAAINANIATTSIIIAIITFLCCAFGVYIGRKFGVLLGIRAKLGGGILLILIGVKIFVESCI